MNYTMESFINWCDNISIPANEAKLSVNKNNGDNTFKGNFFGKPCKIKLSNLGYDPLDKKNLADMKNLMKIATTDKKLYESLYNNNKKFFDYAEQYDYANGRKIRSGSDLISAIQEGIDERGKGLDIIYNEISKEYYMCGEIWIDEEHGFSIKFTNYSGGKVNYNDCEFGQYGDVL